MLWPWRARFSHWPRQLSCFLLPGVHRPGAMYCPHKERPTSQSLAPSGLPESPGARAHVAVVMSGPPRPGAGTFVRPRPQRRTKRPAHSCALTHGLHVGRRCCRRRFAQNWLRGEGGPNAAGLPPTAGPCARCCGFPLGPRPLTAQNGRERGREGGGHCTPDQVHRVKGGMCQVPLLGRPKRDHHHRTDRETEAEEVTEKGN